MSSVLQTCVAVWRDYKSALIDPLSIIDSIALMCDRRRTCWAPALSEAAQSIRVSALARSPPPESNWPSMGPNTPVVAHEYGSLAQHFAQIDSDCVRSAHLNEAARAELISARFAPQGFRPRSGFSRTLLGSPPRHT